LHGPSPEAARLERIFPVLAELVCTGSLKLAQSLGASGLRLQRLVLSSDIGDTGGAALAPVLGGIRHLTLGDTGLGPEGLRAILPSLAHVESLDLGGNPLGPEGAALLAAAPLPALSVLKLARCNIGIDGAKALAASPLLAQLRELDLDLAFADHALIPEGVGALTESVHTREAVRTQLELFLPKAARKRSGFFTRLFGRS